MAFQHAGVELIRLFVDELEIFYNRQRRHSQLGYEAPIIYDLAHEKRSVPASLHAATGNQTVGQVSVVLPSPFNP